MQIEFKISGAYVSQDNVCFKTTFVLVKNMTDRVILGNPFMCLLYPFITDSEGITTHPFGQPVKFKFLRNPEPREIENLQEVSISKNLNLINSKTSSNQAQNLDQIIPSTIFDNSLSFTQPHKLSSHHIAYKRICSMTSHDFNKNVLKDNHFVNTGMSSSNSKNKGKAPIQGFPQKMHEGASSGKEPRKATSLQTMCPETVTYSSGYMAITLQEVKNKALQFRKGVYNQTLTKLSIRENQEKPLLSKPRMLDPPFRYLEP